MYNPYVVNVLTLHLQGPEFFECKIKCTMSYKVLTQTFESYNIVTLTSDQQEVLVKEGEELIILRGKKVTRYLWVLL